MNNVNYSVDVKYGTMRPDIIGKHETRRMVIKSFKNLKKKDIKGLKHRKFKQF